VKLLAVNDIKHLIPAVVTTQPATTTVEIAEKAHPAKKGSLFGTATDKGN
jgi:hypothetical protein